MYGTFLISPGFSLWTSSIQWPYIWPVSCVPLSCAEVQESKQDPIAALDSLSAKVIAIDAKYKWKSNRFNRTQARQDRRRNKEKQIKKKHKETDLEEWNMEKTWPRQERHRNPNPTMTMIQPRQRGETGSYTQDTGDPNELINLERDRQEAGLAWQLQSYKLQIDTTLVSVVCVNMFVSLENSFTLL